MYIQFSEIKPFLDLPAVEEIREIMYMHVQSCSSHCLKIHQFPLGRYFYCQGSEYLALGGDSLVCPCLESHGHFHECNYTKFRTSTWLRQWEMQQVLRSGHLRYRGPHNGRPAEYKSKCVDLRRSPMWQSPISKVLYTCILRNYVDAVLKGEFSFVINITNTSMQCVCKQCGQN